MNNWVLFNGLSAAGVGFVSDFAGVVVCFCLEGGGVVVAFCDGFCFKADLSGAGGVDSSSSSSSSSSPSSSSS